MDNSEGRSGESQPTNIDKIHIIVFFFSCNIFCEVFYFIVNPYAGLYNIFLLQFYFKLYLDSFCYEFVLSLHSLCFNVHFRMATSDVSLCLSSVSACLTPR